MDKDYFLHAGIPPPLQFQTSSAPTWQPLSSAPQLNFLPEQSSDCFVNPSWNKTTDHFSQFESALSSMASSPAPSNSTTGNDGFAIRELIGKLSTISKSGDIPTQPHQLIKENFANLGNSMALHPTLHSLSGDPGFAERAAKFSCFGSRSFNGRATQLQLGLVQSYPELPRVSSSPTLKAAGSPLGVQEINIPAQTQMDLSYVNGTELANSNESSVSEQNPIGEMNSRKRKVISRGKRKEIESTQFPNASKAVEEEEDNSNSNSNSKRSKHSKKGNGGGETEEGTMGSPKPPEPPKDYIHVRARRGQATDSHSLAERVRREKIGERMKLLQDLVPGCNKVTGKALMLDEIINYVQSLQRQVEFLSMKLATVDNPRLDFDIHSLISKEGFHPNGPLPQQSQQIRPNLSIGSLLHSSMDPLETTLNRSIGLQLPPIDENLQGSSQLPMFCEDDLLRFVMGFGQSPNSEAEFHSQSFPGSNQASSNMKIEL